MITVENLLDLLYGFNVRDDSSYTPIKKFIPARENKYRAVHLEEQVNRIDVNLYDRRALSNIIRHAHDNDGCLTEKERKLALKLVHKYRKQLNEKYLLPNIHEWCNNPVWKFGPRTLKEIYKLDFANDFFQLQFPYSKKIVKQIGELIHSNSGISFGNKWIREGKYWQIEPTFSGCEFVVRLMNTVKRESKGQNFIISTEADTVLKNNFVFNVPEHYVSMINGELTIMSFATTKQKELAENILLQPISLYQKISYLAYLNFKFDDSIKEYLANQKGFSDWQIEILCRQNIEFNCTDIPIDKLYEFLKSINLGLIVDRFRHQQSRRVDKILKSWDPEHLYFLSDGYLTEETDIDAENISISHITKVNVNYMIWNGNSNCLAVKQLLDNKYQHNVIASKDIYDWNGYEIPLLINSNLLKPTTYLEDKSFIKIIKLFTTSNEENNLID